MCGLGSEEGGDEAEAAGELAEAEVAERHHKHRENRDCGKHEVDDRVVPCQRRDVLDGLDTEHEPSSNHHASEETEDDLGPDGSACLDSEC